MGAVTSSKFCLLNSDLSPLRPFVISFPPHVTNVTGCYTAPISLRCATHPTPNCDKLQNEPNSPPTPGPPKPYGAPPSIGPWSSLVVGHCPWSFSSAPPCPKKSVSICAP